MRDILIYIGFCVSLVFMFIVLGILGALVAMLLQ